MICAVMPNARSAVARAAWIAVSMAAATQVQAQGAPAYGPAAYEALPVVSADGVPLLLRDYEPAGGPLQRLAGRPGAWYTSIFVPLGPGVVTRLLAWQRGPAHQLRLFALDGWPTTAATVAVAIPLHIESSCQGQAFSLTAPFGLAAGSAASGTFLLLEQWNSTATRPAPLWVQVRSADSPFVAGDSIPQRTGADDCADHRIATPLLAPSALLTGRTKAWGVVELHFPHLNLPAQVAPFAFEPLWNR